VIAKVTERGARDGTDVTVTLESRTPAVRFDPTLVHRCAGRLAPTFGEVPGLTAAAGFDAGVLAEAVPATALYVRNTTGASGVPGEHADGADCAAGVVALAEILAELAGAGRCS
jgi:N-carbamoyl-L-amino-acid hydrolase